MKVINSEVTVQFVAPTFSDAVAILPIVDDLVTNLNHSFNRIPKIEREYYVKDRQEEAKRLQKQLRILMQCGFCASDEDLCDKLLALDIDKEFRKLKFDDKGNRIKEEA